MKPHYRRTANGQTVMVHDGYQNAVANIGTARDKQTFGGYVHIERSPQELLMAYRSAWLPRKIVDIPAMDATRRWRSWNAEKDQITAIEAVEKRLALQRKVRDAMISARLYGGAAIYVSTARGNPEKPANPERDGPVRHLTVIPKSLLTGDHSQWEFDSLNFGLPEFYRIAGKAQRIHHTRLVRFVGAPLPISGTEFTDGWGDSVLEAMFEAILQSDGTAANIASLVYESKVDIIYIPRLMEMVANREGEQAVQNYLRAAMAAKGVNGALILDGGDTSKPERNSGGIRYDSKTQTFGGLDSVWDRFLQAVSGAADIPTTRLLGQSPAGMNATGESDLRNYYDRIQAMQSLDIAPAMELLDQAIVMEATGKPQDEIYYDWRSLWQTTDAERAALGKSAADIITSLKATELWPDEVLAAAGGNALIESGALPGFEAALDEWVEGADDETTEPNLTQPVERASPELRLVGDAAPRPLYVRRDVLNADEVLRWAKAQGISPTLAASDLHVTIAYSRQPLDWMKVGQAWQSKMELPEGGPRVMEQFGEALVLSFASDELQWRHESILKAGASWDHPQFQPHITIGYGTGRLPEEVEPYRGRIVLGPEIFEPIDEGWKEKVTGDEA